MSAVIIGWWYRLDSWFVRSVLEVEPYFRRSVMPNGKSIASMHGSLRFVTFIVS